MQVSTFGIWVALSVVQETAADWQLFHLTGDPVSNVIVLAGTLLLPLPTNTFHLSSTSYNKLLNKATTRSHRCRHGAGGVFVAAAIFL